MFNILTDTSILKSVKDNAYIILRNIVCHPGKTIGYTILIVSACADTNAYADKFVNNTMDYTTINNTIASAVSGEDVHFAAGVYQLPMVQDADYTLNNQGVDLIADGAVTLRGATPTSGRVLSILSIDSKVSGFVIEGAKFGVKIDADFNPSYPVYIQGNTIQNVNTGMYWNNKDVVGSNMLPSVIVDSNYIRAVSRGNIFNEASGTAVNDQKAWAQVSNNTFEDIITIVFEPPIYYVSNGVAASTPVTLGRNAFDGNININNAAVTFPDPVYQGVGGPLTSATTAGTIEDIPDANGEFDIANCRDTNNCAYPFVGYLSVEFGGDNIASENSADAKISWSNRPLLGSPHWADGKCKNPTDGSERHYCGAFSPMGDWNADGKLNDYDQSILESKKTGENVCSTDQQAKSVFDFDNDCDIDNDDHVAFLENGFVGIPTIPATSTWGLIVLALGSLITGTVVLSRRRQPTDKCLI